jgi:hypothetical protein
LNQNLLLSLLGFGPSRKLSAQDLPTDVSSTVHSKEHDARTRQFGKKCGGEFPIAE